MPEQTQQKGLFSGPGLFSPKKPAMPPPAMPSETINKIHKISSRLRISEERHSELRKKLVLIEQNMISNHRKATSEIKSIYSEVTEIKHSIIEIQDKIILIIKEIKNTPRKADIDVMKRYIELWNPVKFIRIDQIDKIIQEKLKEQEE